MAAYLIQLSMTRIRRPDNLSAASEQSYLQAALAPLRNGFALE